MSRYRRGHSTAQFSVKCIQAADLQYYLLLPFVNLINRPPKALFLGMFTFYSTLFEFHCENIYASASVQCPMAQRSSVLPSRPTAPVLCCILQYLLLCSLLVDRRPPQKTQFQVPARCTVQGQLASISVHLYSRCVLLAPWCAFFRCPWMSFPYSAGGVCPFLCPWSAFS